jgi:hypothetical protein
VVKHNVAIPSVSKRLVKFLSYFLSVELGVLQIVGLVAVAATIILTSLVRIVGLVYPEDGFFEVAALGDCTIGKERTDNKYDYGQD